MKNLSMTITPPRTPISSALLIKVCEEYYRLHGPQHDPAHDIHHVRRVLKNVLTIQEKEGGDLEILIPAALLHDIVSHDKKGPRRSQSSLDSARLTQKLLINELRFSYPKSKLEPLYHAICAHASSANIPCESLEAKILFDADKLEFLGCAGIMRTFCSAGIYNVALMDEHDPLCLNRPPKSFDFALDLFFVAHLKVPSLLHTSTAKLLAEKRIIATKAFLDMVKNEESCTYA